jgi:hypothetical protein
MVSAYEDAGYETEAMNVFFIKLYPNLGSYLSYSTTGAGADKTYVMTQIREYTGVSISLGHAYPTVQLPKGCVEDYGAQGVDKLEGYGQKHVNAAPSEVKLDGVIGTSEYTGSFGFTKDDLRSGDGTLEPDVTYNISGTNYFAYDKDNLYFGAKVVDPNYVSGKSTYQLNIGVIDKNANTDIGAGLTRMSLYARVINGNSAVFAGGDKPGVTVRTQGYSSAVESAWAERTPTYATGGYEIAGSYDAATKTITYEYKIPLSVLKAVFDVDTVDTLNIFSYITYNDATTGSNVGVWNMFKPLGEENGAVKALQNYTLSAYGISSLSYSNDKLIYGDIVHLVEADTKPGASIRLSDAKLSGLIIGMTMNTKPHEIYRALIESTAFATKTIFDTLENNGVKIDRLHAGGGIAKKNPFAMQMLSDVLGKEICVSSASQIPALASAIYASVAAGSENGGYSSISEATKRMAAPFEVTYLPDVERQSQYMRLYNEYLILHDFFGRGGNDVMKRLRVISDKAKEN